jgi:hypothetical protein
MIFGNFMKLKSYSRRGGNNTAHRDASGAIRAVPGALMCYVP